MSDTTDEGQDATGWPPEAGLADELGRVRARLSFLRACCLLLVSCNVALLGLVLTMGWHQPLTLLQVPAGRETLAEALPDVPVDLPLPGAEDWAIDTGRRVWGLAPGDWTGRLAAQGRFTEKGWSDFEDSALGTTDGVSPGGEAAWSQPLAPPVLVSEGPKDGIYAWRFSFPVRIWTETGDIASSREASVEMLVVRRPRAEGGMAVARLAEVASAPAPRNSRHTGVDDGEAEPEEDGGNG